ncbi:hypothetical protein FA15DRAFT_581170 [Coprinopsis marcescibilis]|uniref:CTLH domain-containing protein n=1 Tax=Coprinopsis marcescibilis TaxID=230819 RepID=A0A5C3LC43_COPMA|nr:hypothetical protein FA15DRAFT_581170 [Coprinopsis marcescibilis]
MTVSFTLSDLLGYISIACWLGAQFPQVLENMRRQSCEGLALPFLANWLLGDISNLVGCILTHQLPFQKYLATYFVAVDCTLVAQYIYYYKPAKPTTQFGHARVSATPGTARRLSGERGASRYRTLSTVAANVAAAAALAAQQQEAQPGSARTLRNLPYGTDELQAGLRSALSPEQYDEDDDDEANPALSDSFHSEGGRRLGRKRKAYSVERHGRGASIGRYPPLPQSSTQQLLPADTGATGPASVALVDADMEELEPSRTRRNSRASRRNASMVFLAAWAIFSIGNLAESNRGVVSSSSTNIGRLLFPQSLRTDLIPAALVREPSTLKISEVTFVAPRTEDEIELDLLPEDDEDVPDAHAEKPQFDRILGRIFAWLCTTLYLTSRLPQIWKNFVRKSVEGLSMYLFIFAFLGNLFYVASILFSPKAYLPPPESANFIRESIPYLLGSGGTLMFDITIVIQSHLYRPKPKRHQSLHSRLSVSEEEAGLLSADAYHPPLSAGESAIQNRGRASRTRSKWISTLRSPTPYQLRALVLDYLNHHCYTATSRAFIRESTVKALDMDGDEVLDGMGVSSSISESRLQQVEQRREIRELILNGDVEEAIDLLNRYFPSVLAETPGSSPAVDTTLKPLSHVETGPFDGYSLVSSTSIDPAHLLLNLRILAFAEACRTQPVTRPFKESATSIEDNEAMDTSEHHLPLSSDPNHGAEMSAEKQSLLLSKAQKLYVLVNTLPNQADRETYGKELRNVAGLLAYRVPEKSTVSKYLGYERREAVADQINRAILHRCGLPSVPEIELVARYTTALWGMAKQHGAKPRPGVVLPPSSSTSSKPDGEPEVCCCLSFVIMQHCQSLHGRNCPSLT